MGSYVKVEKSLLLNVIQEMNQKEENHPISLFERELRESSRRLSSGHLQIRGDILKIEGRSRLCEGDGNTTFFHKLAQLQDSGGK